MRNIKRKTRKLLWALRVAQVRLRFPLVLLAAFLIVGKWHVLRNYWETLTTPTPSRLVTGDVNQATEYFCPMCPGVISAWPTKCSVCNMPLVRRKKGGGEQLPDGVLARMQISPDRIQLAGIETAAIDYQPLAREIETYGIVSLLASGKAEAEQPGVISGASASVGNGLHAVPHSRELSRPFRELDHKTAGNDHSVSGASTANEVTKIVQAEMHQREIGLVQPGVAVVILPDVELAEPLTGSVLRVFREVAPKSHRVKIEVAASDAADALWPGMEVRLRFRRPMTELEPFRSRPADPPPPVQGELRKLFACAEHPDVLREKRERCPHDNAMLMDLPLTDLERVEWWCPMHPEIVSGERGRTCEHCGGRRLVPRIVQYRPAGEVLAVPTSAVVDLGDRRVVFIERMPGMFDAVEVTIGPRCGGYYPIVSGLQPGQRVAARGAFLLDAETRLNPSVAAGYFGASLGASGGGAGEAHHHDAKQSAAIRDALSKLTPQERAAAEKQKTCPVTGMPLGSMGTPVKLEIGGQTVWLCCAGCEAEAAENPTETLEKLKRQNKRK